MKKIFPYILFISLFVYLIIVLTFASMALEKIKCQGIRVRVEDAEESAFVDEKEVLRLIERNYRDLQDVYIAEIDKDSIERLLTQNSMIKSAEIYYCLDGYFYVEISQRKPILRVVTRKGYYVDEDGKIMPLSNKYTSRVVVATGKISDSFACQQLYPFVMELKKDEFWDALIEQMIVTDEQEVVLIPKVGNFRIVMGELKNVEQKMENLRLFLREGIVLKGWNKYKEINLKYENQIVCVKR